MSKLKEACKEYMEWLKSDDYNEDGLSKYEHYIFETAIKQELGEDIFDEINEYIV